MKINLQNKEDFFKIYKTRFRNIIAKALKERKNENFEVKTNCLNFFQNKHNQLTLDNFIVCEV
jgi:hypothetical protein